MSRNDVRLSTSIHLSTMRSSPLNPGRLVNRIHDNGGHISPARPESPATSRSLGTKDSHGHRAWDRRRGHHQDMWPRARLGAECCALFHPEPMLLIDHDQTEVRELHIGAEQGMGADDDPCRT